MIEYAAKHRAPEPELPRADTEEIQRILGLMAVPARTMEQIRAGIEPDPDPDNYPTIPIQRPLVVPWTGPPAWQIRNRLKWILSWRKLDDGLQKEQGGWWLV